MLQLPCSTLTTNQKITITKHQCRCFRKMIYIKVFIAMWDWNNMLLIYITMAHTYLQYFHWIQEHMKWLKDHQNRQGFAEEDPSWRVHGVGDHLGFWKKNPKVELDLPAKFYLSCRYSYNSNRFVSIHWCYLFHIHEYLHWWVTQ